MEILKSPYPRIYTLEELISLSDLCVSKATNLVIYNMTTYLDVNIMMKYGLFPTENFDKATTDKLTMNESTYNFWHRDSPTSITKYRNNSTWYYSTLETHKQNGVQLAISIPLLYLAPHLVYNESKRPKNDMLMFRSPLSITISKDDIVDNKVLLNNILWNVIPVTRYARGMSKGMYYSDLKEPVEFCGTFYYNEPESDTYLAYQTFRVYFNKTVAAIKLGEEFGENNDLTEAIPNNKALMMHINGELPSNLMMTPLELSNFIKNNGLSTRGLAGQRYNEISPNKEYVGMDSALRLYSAEDGLDQILCQIGKKHGIDIIILTHMVGSHQVVTEILDTRIRVESFKSLIYTSLS